MKRTLPYIVLTIVLLYAVRACEYAGLRRVQGGEFAKLRTVFEEKNNFDLVIIGSSRAECQFYNPIIDSATGLRSYNLGMTGAVMPLIASTLEAYLVNSAPPKYVVLNLDLHSLGDNTDTVYKFPRYFAFLGNEKLYEGLVARDQRFLFFRWLPFYSMPYFSNRYLSNSVRGWLNKPTQYDGDYEQGFAPSIPDTTLGDLDTAQMLNANPDIPPAIWESMERIRIVCSENNCRLIMVVSPLFHRQEESVANYMRSFEAFRIYADANQIPFLDYGHDSIRFQKEFYADPAHLNRAGAKIFTRRFSSGLMQYLRP
jgi:hypothetical protein